MNALIQLIRQQRIDLPLTGNTVLPRESLRYYFDIEVRFATPIFMSTGMSGVPVGVIHNGEPVRLETFR